MISTHLHLFKVNCPIIVDRFKELLVDHPNQPFVKSVCRALHEGFWPFANTRYGDYPTTWDFSERELQDPEHANFIAKQVEAEVLKGRYSEDFGPDLLPGMYLTPVHAVPKPGTDTYWLINDQSAGEYSPNSMIHPDDIAGTCMDSIKSLGTSLLAHWDSFGDEELVIFKADIKEVYHLMWMCPEWQAKQVVTVGVKRHVDFCNCFGSRASYKVFLSFTSLAAWIAEHLRQIRNLKIYIDDNAGFGPARRVLYYELYKHYFPTDQTKLLLLWDKLGIPHEERKQIYRPIIPFIGFDVDPNAMTFSISDECRNKLIDKIREFAILGKQHALKDFQALGGHINWSLAVFPLLKPSLSVLYAKISGKSERMRPIHVNTAMCREPDWFIKHTSTSNGIYLLKSLTWNPTRNIANTTICYTNACMGGLAIWYPELHLGYQCHIPQGYVAPIFYWEAVAVACAMISAVTPKTTCLVVYTDNQNTADIWHSLKASAPYNFTLIHSIDWLINNNIDAHVLHVPGIKNQVADALSRFNNALAL